MRKLLAALVAALTLAGLTLVATPAAWAHDGPGWEPASGHSDADHAVVTAVVAQQTGVEALEPLAVDCSGSQLAPHTGFQEAPACVSTAFGEVSDAPLNPSLLIVDSPRKIREGKDFELKVSTRNLVRDRFLAAAQGGYYLESALLNAEGLTRGHFHTACRVLNSTDEAPNPDVVPEFFKATEDGQGGAAPDVVTLVVPGKKADGNPTFRKGQLVQCSAWAGDGSHRIPMMERANETPAFDAVRIPVRG